MNVVIMDYRVGMRLKTLRVVMNRAAFKYYWCSSSKCSELLHTLALNSVQGLLVYKYKHQSL